MSRWFWWFVLAPQSFLLAGLVHEVGLPRFDMAIAACLYLAWFARPAALPFLLLGCAIGRALVDDASLPIQILALGVPVAVLLPLRTLFVAQHWLWQAVAASLLAIALPKLCGLLGQLFDEPSVAASLRGWHVVWAALLVPPGLWLLRRLPPFAAFTEPEPVFGGHA